MWHAFDLMQAEFAPGDHGPAVAGATTGASRRLVYGERVLARFPTKDKIGVDKQWKPAVDRLPGISLVRHPSADGRWTLEVDQHWQFAAVDHRLTGRMTVNADDWRSPAEWSFRQELTPHKERPALTPLDETGRWSDGTIHRTCKAGRGDQSSSHPAASLASVYALLADFPTDLAQRGGEASALLLDGFAVAGSATLGPGHDVPRHLPAAEGLRNYLLRFDGGLPLEFWVNDASVVVYACQGPTRVLVLERAEDLP